MLMKNEREGESPASMAAEPAGRGYVDHPRK